MRIKYLDWVDPETGDVIKERATLQEYINYFAVYLAKNYDDIFGPKEQELSDYNENKAYYDEKTGGDSYEDLVVYNFKDFCLSEALSYSKEYSYDENSFTETYTLPDGSKLNTSPTYTLVED